MRRSTALPLIGLAGMLGGCTVVQPLPQVAAAPAASPSSPYCREYTATGMVGGQPQETVGTACLDANGHWRIVPGEGTAGQQAGGAAPPPVVTYPFPYASPFPAYSYLYPYPAWYWPRASLGLGFRFGGHHRHRFHHHRFHSRH